MDRQAYYQDGRITLYLGDCLEVMPDLPAQSIDAIVTDPPYGLEFMGKDWDAPWKDANGFRRRDNQADVNRDSVFGRTSARGPQYQAGIGFQRWCELWAIEALRVAKPGAHLLAFGGTRTYHRLACAIEDAGWEIRDCIMWVYGSGFPKSLDVSKAIDKAAGVERQRVPGPASGGMASLNKINAGHGYRDDPYYDDGNRFLSSEPITEAAERWQGWGTALKPAVEPIVVARKPLIGTVAANVLTHGTGAMNIDGCRVATEGPTARPPLSTNKHDGWCRPWNSDPAARAACEARRLEAHDRRDTLGRWPANLIHDGSDEVVELFPTEAGAAAPVHKRNGDKFRNAYGAFKGDVDEAGSTFHADSGSAARFFYAAKAPADERNGSQHPTVKPLALMRYLVRLVTPPDALVLDPFVGSGTTLAAARLESCRAIGIDKSEEYCADALRRIARQEPRLF